MSHFVCRYFLLFILVTTVAFNVYFFMYSSYSSVPSVHAHQGTLSKEDISSWLAVSIISSKTVVKVSINDKVVLDVDSESEKYRGLNVVVLNERTGDVTSIKNFDTYIEGAEAEFLSFTDSISDGRIVLFAVKDEASFHLSDVGRNMLERVGASKIQDLEWRESYALIGQKKAKFRSSLFKPIDCVGKRDDSGWGIPCHVTANIPLDLSSRLECFLGTSLVSNDDARRRRLFCDKYDGYGDMCSCSNIKPLATRRPVPGLMEIPLIIMASNRPVYLYRCLFHLFNTAGVNPDNILIAIDGYHDEPYELAKLFGLKVFRHEPKGKNNGRICHHYKKSLTYVFDQAFPEHDGVILLEEDLQVAPDFFHYFSQTMPLLEKDPTLLCISAWNDQGYRHSSRDPALLYRVGTMPGLGWLLTRTLYKKELEIKWPQEEKNFDWDMWLRLPQQRKDRECVIPDLPRTFHFGSVGVNMNSFFQLRYFAEKSLSKVPIVKFDTDVMVLSNYDNEIERLIRRSHPLNHSMSPCKHDFIPPASESVTQSLEDSKVFLMVIATRDNDINKVWIRVATCFKLWDLDSRGAHSLLWRFFLNGHHIIVVSDRSKFVALVNEIHPGLVPINLNKERQIEFYK